MVSTNLKLIFGCTVVFFLFNSINQYSVSTSEWTDQPANLRPGVNPNVYGGLGTEQGVEIPQAFQAHYASSVDKEVKEPNRPGVIVDTENESYDLDDDNTASTGGEDAQAEEAVEVEKRELEAQRAAEEDKKRKMEDVVKKKAAEAAAAQQKTAVPPPVEEDSGDQPVKLIMTTYSQMLQQTQDYTAVAYEGAKKAEALPSLLTSYSLPPEATFEEEFGASGAAAAAAASIVARTPVGTREAALEKARNDKITLVPRANVPSGVTRALVFHDPADLFYGDTLAHMFMGVSTSAGAGPGETELDRVDDPYLLPPSKDGLVALPSIGTYMVYNRKDYRTTVATALENLGMEPSNTINKFDVYWGLQWRVDSMDATFLNPRLKDRTASWGGPIYVNAVPGLMETLGEKESVMQMQVACVAAHGVAECNFVPMHFAFEKTKKMISFESGSVARWRAALDHSKEQVTQWIIKPGPTQALTGSPRIVSVKRGEVSSQKQFSRWVSDKLPNGNWRLEHYIAPAAMYNDRKFTLRVWMMVASLYPLRIYFFKEGFPRISTKPYDFYDLSNPCMHLYMPMGPGCDLHDAVWPYPATTADPNWEPSMQYEAGKNHPWKTEVWPSVKRQLLKVLLLARNSMIKYDDEIRNKGNYKYRRFALISADVIIDTHAQVFIENINPNGFVFGDWYPLFWQAEPYVQEMFKLLGLGGFDRSAYQDVVDYEMMLFCGGRPEGCTEREKQVVWELVDEEFSLSNGNAPNWERGWPLYKNRGGADKALYDSVKAFVKTPLKTLDQIVVDFMLYRKK